MQLLDGRNVGRPRFYGWWALLISGLLPTLIRRVAFGCGAHCSTFRQAGKARRVVVPNEILETIEMGATKLQENLQTILKSFTD